MQIVRPEASAALRKWRDVLVALFVTFVGLWWAIGSFGVVRWLGFVLIVAGIGLAAAGIQRARFRKGGGGPGVVTVDERRLVYYGPLTGGVLDMGDLTRLELEPNAQTAPHWVLTGIGGQMLTIPVNAEGAEGLFDVFATLPGIRTERMLESLARTPAARVTIWETGRPRLH